MTPNLVNSVCSKFTDGAVEHTFLAAFIPQSMCSQCLEHVLSEFNRDSTLQARIHVTPTCRKVIRSPIRFACDTDRHVSTSVPTVCTLPAGRRKTNTSHPSKCQRCNEHSVFERAYIVANYSLLLRKSSTDYFFFHCECITTPKVDYFFTTCITLSNSNCF